jgi:hypothetical protein
MKQIEERMRQKEAELKKLDDAKKEKQAAIQR